MSTNKKVQPEQIRMDDFEARWGMVEDVAREALPACTLIAMHAAVIALVLVALRPAFVMEKRSRFTPTVLSAPRVAAVVVAVVGITHCYPTICAMCA